MDVRLFIITTGLIIMIDIISLNVQCEITQFSSVQQLNAYFEKFFATNQSITSQEWHNALPTSIERSQMKKVRCNLSLHYKSIF